MTNVLQQWVSALPMMQQTVLLSAIRGPDGIGKFHKCKDIIRWFRRCILLSAVDDAVIINPFVCGGGSFTGPCGKEYRFGADTKFAPGYVLKRWPHFMVEFTDAFMDSRDELPLHYWTHMMHAFEVIGYKHPNPEIRAFWLKLYERMVHAFHIWPETEAQMDARLGDNLEGWQKRNDSSSVCSD